MIPSRAEQGLHNLATDIRNALRKHESGEIQTTESKNGAIINNIYNYPSRTVSTKYGFVRTVWLHHHQLLLLFGDFLA